MEAQPGRRRGSGPHNHSRVTGPPRHAQLDDRAGPGGGGQGEAQEDPGD